MEQNLLNKKTVKKNAQIKQAQKKSKKYFGDRLFEKRNGEPKTRIQKFADITDISFRDLTGENQSEQEKQTAASREALMALLQKAGLTGRSGNGFATADKLADYTASQGVLLINGVECDPGLVHDAWIYRNKLKEVSDGIRILNQIFHFERVILATKEPLAETDNTFEQVKILNRFPMGYENYLIRTVLGTEIPNGKRPSQMGILVLNLQTVLAIAEIMKNPEAGKYKYITVADFERAKAITVRVKTGTGVKEAAELAFPEEKSQGRKLYTGGGAFMCHGAEENEMITDGTGLIAYGQMPDYENAGKCVGCGGCSANCPAGVNVAKIVQHVEKFGRTDSYKCKKFHPELCIGCGACTYMCHAGKDIRGMVAWAKNN